MFTLRGAGGCGKSTKIKQLAAWILANYPHIINHDVDLTKGDIVGVLELGKLKIGFVSTGDDFNCVLHNDHLLNKHPDLDILVNTSRTRGPSRDYIEHNYNYSTGWLVKNIYVEKFYLSNPVKEIARDKVIFDELVSWLTGLEKL